ncbi:hypothetical protein KR093_003246 [Drosophila rubida]|uniref:Cytochrome c1, heme protein, mitochondrial n=1 Tax=Drosophila rubida TaxID=30044 RepID=A0AAD4JT18_9MUSC|nr:hypothetical protein KR093_003246 [Drosophila rubida]
MASKLLSVSSKLLKTTNNTINWTTLHRSGSTNAARTWFSGRSKLWTFGAVTGAAGLLLYALDASVDASSDCVHPAKQNWAHNGLLSAIDKEGVRRGYKVYKEVCSTCHTLDFIAYRNLVGVCMTEAEAKAEAEAITVQDGPDEQGNYYERPGKLSDHFPAPYPNEEAARSANNGAYPPDLSYIISARKNGEDYLFSLLTGYCDPPAGFQLREGLYYNPYFSGGAIAMGQLIDNEVVTYDDADIAPTGSQIAKDVVTFLKWTSEPDGDERKVLLLKVIIISAFLGAISYYIKRFKWSTLKTRKIVFMPEVYEQNKAKSGDKSPE